MGHRVIRTPLSQAAIVQPKTIAASLIRRPPVAPPVYRPQPGPNALQAKMSADHEFINRSRHTTTPPPAYRPQVGRRVMQPKIVSGRESPGAKSQRIPVAPRVYRPEARKIVQAKVAPTSLVHMPTAPAVYRPQPIPRMLQTKKVQAGTNASGQSHLMTHPSQNPGLKHRSALLESNARVTAGSIQRSKSEAGENRLGARNAAQLAVSGARGSSTVRRGPAHLTSGASQLNAGVAGGPPRRFSFVIQRVLNAAGEAYLEHVRNNPPMAAMQRPTRLLRPSGFGLASSNSVKMYSVNWRRWAWVTIGP